MQNSMHAAIHPVPSICDARSLGHSPRRVSGYHSSVVIRMQIRMRAVITVADAQMDCISHCAFSAFQFHVMSLTLLDVLGCRFFARSGRSTMLRSDGTETWAFILGKTWQLAGTFHSIVNPIS